VHLWSPTLKKVPPPFLWVFFSVRFVSCSCKQWQVILGRSFDYLDLDRDVVPTKMVWERTRKTSHFTAAYNSF